MEAEKDELTGRVTFGDTSPPQVLQEAKREGPGTDPFLAPLEKAWLN